MSNPTPTFSAEVMAAAAEYNTLRNRDAHPAGRFDRAGRWYPDRLCPACNDIRQPSRAFPYSLLFHARSAAHIAAVYGVDRRELLQCARSLPGKPLGIEPYLYAEEVSYEDACEMAEYYNRSALPGMRAHVEPMCLAPKSLGLHCVVVRPV